MLLMFFVFSDAFWSIQLYSSLFYLIDVIVFCLSFLNTDLIPINWFHDPQMKTATLEDRSGMPG